MEDVEFTRSHSKSPLPEAGNDLADPLRPEIDEENSTPNPPIGDPDQDMEVTETRPGEMPDQDDVEAGLSDNESVLSEALDDDQLDEQFGDFDINNVAIDERPAQAIDEDNVKQIEGDRRSKRSKKGGKAARGASPEGDPDEHLTPEERRKKALNAQIDSIVKGGSNRRRKKDGIDLEQMADQEIEEMRRRMAAAAEADNEGRKRNEPARHKLKLLPEVTALLNKNTLRDTIVDPEVNLLESVRFFLEPLSDGSLPAYDIQKDLFASLAKLPVNKDTLVASGIGKVIMFYIKSKKPELTIKRQAERLFTDWTRPILRRTDDYRKKEFAQADYDPTQTRNSEKPINTQEAARAATRKKALEAPRAFQRARMESGPTTYTIAPKSNVVFNENARNRSSNVDIMKQIRGGRGGARR
ncbi:Transcription factor IWS1 [Pyrenophora tritici-repentis]|nr:Transcription factor IWS1 [Pyrenophora tritici-repentis]KAI0572262.1 Transcription factor IWS1 [Pyrenophora tritici-repentis]